MHPPVQDDVHVDDDHNADEEHDEQVEEEKVVPFLDGVETMNVEVQQIGEEDGSIWDDCDDGDHYIF